MFVEIRSIIAKPLKGGRAKLQGLKSYRQSQPATENEEENKI